ncbi:hypothetical protein [Candidatus Thiosymbion oneisti]|uniref:hypothetical protein n=1 Tax=Candidatus Thiosymbion oneisti TaxID=589554 RepID=UPI000B7E7ADE|nr:hypothetical protein [Candidatus Thiosymbion oneisti]
MARALDTLELFDELKSSFTEDQAHVLSKALRQVEEARLEELATKQDLINLETRIDARLVALEGKIIKWIVGLAVALFSALIAILLKLP